MGLSNSRVFHLENTTRGLRGQGDSPERQGKCRPGTTGARHWEPLALLQLPTMVCSRTWTSHRPLFASVSLARKWATGTSLVAGIMRSL